MQNTDEVQLSQPGANMTEDTRRKIRGIVDGLYGGWHSDGRTAAARERFGSTGQKVG